ncbi:MAG TPA: VWA domain-containing protein [Vicinamibacterales bacterium]|nr:VWA domain-containing protein [Vicinamibacterales bacterium]
MRRIALLIVSSVALLTTAAAQDPPRPTFRLTSDLVIVDLLPTGPNGQFVADLQPSEIQVLQNGKPQKIQFVTLVRGGAAVPSTVSPAAGSAQTMPSAPAAGPADASPAVPPTSLAIVLDLQATPVDTYSFVRRAIAEMIDQLPAGTRVLLATVRRTVTVRQPFTDDKAALHAALGSLFESTDGPSLMSVFEAGERLCDGHMPAAPIAGMMSDPTPALRQTITLGRSLIQEWEQQLRTTADALGAVAASMAPLPGRKHVVLYSTGYAINPGAAVIDLLAEANAACGGASVEDVRRQVGSELAAYAQFTGAATLQQMADRANRAQVSFYTIDPRGLLPTNLQARSTGSARGARSGNLGRVAQLQVTLPQEFLRVVSAETGGRAFLNTNDLGAGLRRAWQDASEYYLIGYTPSGSPKKGAFHRIEVKVSRPNLDLRYRAGYYEATDKEVATREIEAALRLPEAFAHTGLEIEAQPRGRKLRVVAFLPPDAVQFTGSGSTQAGEISVHATLRDSEGKLVGNKPLFGRDIALRFSPEQIAGLRQSDNLEVPVEVDAPRAGTYRLTVVARASGGWVGAQTTTIDVR